NHSGPSDAAESSLKKGPRGNETSDTRPTPMPGNENGWLFVRGNGGTHWTFNQWGEIASAKWAPHAVVTRPRDSVSVAMSEWSEDNFLERLAQSAAERMSTGICPKADDVSANVDSGGLKAISDELRQHMQHCPACSDLQRRLTLFEQASGSETSPDTLEAEGRLGAWLRGFLASQDLRRQVLAAPPPKGVELAFTPKRRPFWQMQWALAAAAAIVLAAGLIYFRRQAMVLQPRQEVAYNPPQPQSSLVLDSRSPSNSATARDRQAKDSAAKPSLTHQSTKVSSPRPVSPTEAPGPPSSEQRSQQVVAQTPPQTEGTRDETPRTVSTSPAATAQPARVALSRQPTPVPGAGSTPQRIAAAPLSAPQRVGLPVGSRIWLKLDSVMPD